MVPGWKSGWMSLVAQNAPVHSKRLRRMRNQRWNGQEVMQFQEAYGWGQGNVCLPARMLQNRKMHQTWGLQDSHGKTWKIIRKLLWEVIFKGVHDLTSARVIGIIFLIDLPIQHQHYVTGTIEKRFLQKIWDNPIKIADSGSRGYGRGGGHFYCNYDQKEQAKTPQNYSASIRTSNFQDSFWENPNTPPFHSFRTQRTWP